MIIGSGAIAKCLTDREGTTLFAAGVSNSRCDDQDQFEREQLRLFMIHRLNPETCLFYFSSIQCQFSTNAYFKHKLNMEKYVRSWFDNYVILRIGNLIGDTNPNTFINYIKNRQAQGLSVEIRDEYKYMIDGATLNMLCQTLPLDQKIELTIATKIAKVKDLL